MILDNPIEEIRPFVSSKGRIIIAILVHLASTSIVIVTKDVNMVFALFSFVYPSYYLYALRQAIILLDRQNTSKA